MFLWLLEEADLLEKLHTCNELSISRVEKKLPNVLCLYGKSQADVFFLLYQIQQSELTESLGGLNETVNVKIISSVYLEVMSLLPVLSILSSKMQFK